MTEHIDAAKKAIEDRITTLKDELKRLEAASTALGGGRRPRTGTPGTSYLGKAPGAATRQWHSCTSGREAGAGKPRHHHPRDPSPEDGHPAELPVPGSAGAGAGWQGPQGGPGLVPRSPVREAELLFDRVALLLELVDRGVDPPARSRRSRGPRRSRSRRPRTRRAASRSAPPRCRRRRRGDGHRDPVAVGVRAPSRGRGRPRRSRPSRARRAARLDDLGAALADAGMYSFSYQSCVDLVPAASPSTLALKRSGNMVGEWLPQT